MRYFLFLWVLPVGGLAAWLFMASNDFSFGSIYFSRDFFDLVFGLYANILGVDAAILPPLVYKALVVDTLIVAGLFALKRRKDIIAWWKSRGFAARLQSRVTAIAVDGPIHPAE
jgi:Family of unknown function (DUF6105)